MSLAANRLPIDAVARGLASQSTTSGLPSLYLGQVATSGLIPDSKNAGAAQLMSRTPHLARDNITSLQLVFGNFYVAAFSAPTNGTEAPLGASAAQIQVAIEYPTGVFSSNLTFSGAIQGAIPAGGLLVTDAVSVNIPFGAQFWVRTWWSNPDGICYCSYPNLGNLLNFGTTTPNLTVTAGSITSQTAAGYGPLAIIAQTRRASFGLAGDSRVVGLGDTPDGTLARGYLARAVGTAYGYINMGTGTDRAMWAKANYTNRSQLMAYVSHIIVNYGINDINSASQTSVQTLASLQTFYGLTGITGKPLWQTTYEPIGGTTSNSWTTEAGQTPGASNSVRVTANDAIRGGTAGSLGVVDIALSLESATLTGVWKAPDSNALTADGAHANLRGNLQAQTQVQIPAGPVAR